MHSCQGTYYKSSSSHVKKLKISTQSQQSKNSQISSNKGQIKQRSKGRSISLSINKEDKSGSAGGQKRSQSKGGNSDGGRITAFDPDNFELPIKFGGNSLGNSQADSVEEELKIKRCESAVQADFFSSDGDRISGENEETKQMTLQTPQHSSIAPLDNPNTQDTVQSPADSDKYNIITEANQDITEESTPEITIQSRNNFNGISSDPSSAYFNNSLDNSDEGFSPMPRMPVDMKKIFAENNFPDAVPVMARQTNYIDTGPPKCPLEQVKFIELKKFRICQAQLDNMNTGFNLVDQRRKLRDLRQAEANAKGGARSRHGSPDSDSGKKVPKIDASTHYIKNIVYARDPTILDKETLRVNQREAFAHENNLDVKKMIQKREELNAIKNAATTNMPKIRWQKPPQAQKQQPPVIQKPPLEPQIHQLEGENDKTLVFESRFESGNLYLAQKVTDNEYNLLMQNDINTNGHTQWFFFRVTNAKPGLKVKFNVLNYAKPDSLFNYGMKVSIYSDKEAEKNDLGWHKGGEDISYFNNGIRKEIIYSSKTFYTATFTYKFKHADDSVFFAYAQPYTFTDLRNDLDLIHKDPERKQFINTKVLCQTLSGTSCEYLTITAKKKVDGKNGAKEEKKADKKPGVIISARVHPGETVGSHMMKGVLTFLTDPTNPEAQLLRENFVFKVIPMLNPDGVINGNYRCSLAGCDLNRRWKTPSKQLHPTIYYTKKLIKQVHEERGVVLFCDLHGHSRKQNVFMYGCHKKENPGICRIFPYLLSKMNPYFIFEESRFGVQKSKESTARVAMFKEINRIPCIYTMESSFAGMDRGKHQGVHFTDLMLMTLGVDLCRSILAYHNIYIAEELRQLPMFQKIIEANKSNVPQIDTQQIKPKWSEDDEKNKTVRDCILAEFSGNKKLMDIGQGDSTSGSDDLPSEDNKQVEELAKQLPETKTIKNTLKKALKDKADAKKKEIEEEAAKKKEELKQKRLEAMKPKAPELPKPIPRKTYVRPTAVPKKGEGIDMHTQTERSYVGDMKAKQAAERDRLAGAERNRRDIAQLVNTPNTVVNDIMQVKRDPQASKPPMTNQMRSTTMNLNVPENLLTKPQSQPHSNPFSTSMPSSQNKVQQNVEMSAPQAQAAMATGVNFHNYMQKQPIQSNAIKQMVNRQSPNLSRAHAQGGHQIFNPNNLSPNRHNNQLAQSAGSANRDTIWNTQHSAAPKQSFKAGTQQQQQHQGFLKLQQHRAAQLDGMVTTTKSPRMSAQTEQHPQSNLLMTGMTTGEQRSMPTTNATNSSLGNAASPSRQELTSASALAIHQSKQQRNNIGIEGNHMKGLDDQRSPHRSQLPSPMTNKKFESINDQKSESNFSIAPKSKPPQSERMLSPTARSLPNNQQKQGFLAKAQNKEINKQSIEGTNSKTRQSTPVKVRNTSGNKMKELRQHREQVGTAESQITNDSNKPPLRSPGQPGQSAKMGSGIIPTDGSSRKYMVSPRTQKLQQAQQLNPIATQNGVKKRQDGQRQKGGPGDEISHMSSKSSDPNSRRMVKGHDEPDNNHGNPISVAHMVGMNLSGSAKQNKYRTNSQNNTAGRTYGGGHFEGLQSTKLPNLDPRHQPKETNEIQLQNKLPQTPTQPSGKFQASKYASPTGRNQAQIINNDVYDPRYSTEQRVGPQGPPFTRTSHTEKKRQYNPQLNLNLNATTPANLVQITRQEEAGNNVNIKAMCSPKNQILRKQAQATQQNRQFNNTDTTFQSSQPQQKMQVMVPNANGTMLGGSIVPGRNVIVSKLGAEAEGEIGGSPKGLRRTNFKPATSTTLQQSDDEAI